MPSPQTEYDPIGSTLPMIQLLLRAGVTFHKYAYYSGTKQWRSVYHWKTYDDEEFCQITVWDDYTWDYVGDDSPWAVHADPITTETELRTLLGESTLATQLTRHKLMLLIA